MVSEKTWPADAVARLVGGVFAGLFLGMMLNGLVAALLKSWDKDDLQLVHFLIGTLCFQGTVLVLTQLFLYEQNLSWADAFGFNSPGRLRTILLALVASVLVLVVAMQLGWLSAQLLMLFGIEPEPQEAVQIMQNTASLSRQMLYGSVAILLAPVTEEFLFRGLLYPTIKQAGYPRLALWGTSVLFGLIHFNAMSLVSLIFVAWALTLLYEKTNNLLAPILTHSLFNAANFVLLLNEREINRWLHS